MPVTTESATVEVSSASNAPSIEKMFRAHSSSTNLLLRQTSNASKINIDDVLSVVTSGNASVDVDDNDSEFMFNVSSAFKKRVESSGLGQSSLGDCEPCDIDDDVEFTTEDKENFETGKRGKENEEPVEKAPAIRRISSLPESNVFLREIEISREIDITMKEFQLSADDYIDVMESLEVEMNRGLDERTHPTAAVRMFPTYVCSLPTGQEQGYYVALDLGGTNFRVLLVHLQPGQAPQMTAEVFLIPSELMHADGTQLFEYIASSLVNFLTNRGLASSSVTLPLGFTFSFPCLQDSLSSARLARWTKGFTCPGVQGQDVVQLLQQAIDKIGTVNVKCKAIINDNVGALLAGALTHHNFFIGLILGTGTNCCYVEKQRRIGTVNNFNWGKHDRMVVNTEWGGFGDNGVIDHIRTRFDIDLDKNSLNPGCQKFEKMISGMYMGEIVRRVLCDLTSRGLLFAGVLSDDLATPGSFLTKYVSEIGGDDPDGDFANTRLVLEELCIGDVTACDCRNVQYVCWQVSQRAAFLAAAALATIINRLEMDDVSVAVDGSLYRFHPHFKDLMLWKLKQLVNPSCSFELNLTLDGSGIGASLAAAIAED